MFLTRGLVVSRSSADLTRWDRYKIQIIKGTGNRALFCGLTNLLIFSPKGICVCGECFLFGIADFSKFTGNKGKICGMIEVFELKLWIR